MGGHGDLSLHQAQRIAVAAQGLTSPRSAAASSRVSLERVYATISQTQVDSVNVVCRAHYQPLFARLGHYRTETLDKLVATARSGITEYWGHEASYVRSELIGDLRRWRSSHWADQSAHFSDRQQQLVGQVMAYLQEHPGSSARQISGALDLPAADNGTHWGWNWNDAKLVTESLFWNTQILSLGRNSQFERRFALAEDVVDPAHVHPPHDKQDSLRRLVLAAIDALGITTTRSIAEYFRLPLGPVRLMASQLQAEGTIDSHAVPGITEPMQMRSGTAVPSRVSRTVRILSPFDSMVFDRNRLLELFGFHYRIEIYVPQPKRKYGYYVFPILYGHRFVGRVDLKADRGASALRVNALYFEAPPDGQLLTRVDEELWRMAGWLGLDSVSVSAEQTLCTPWSLASKCQTTG